MDNKTTGKSASDVGRQPVKAIILNVLIASPSDVSAERDAIESAIHEWNTNHHAQTGIVLQPVRWETHSYPAIGDRPQGILNKQIVDSAHLLIGIFGSRLGTPTGEAQSGTIEEIEQFRKTGRYVALYFSNAPRPRNADRNQLEALERYQKERQQDTLYSRFDTADDLRRLVTQHLPKIVSEVYEALRNAKPKTTGNDRDRSSSRDFAPSRASETLSPKEMELLWNAVKDPRGEVLHSQTMDGEGIRANGRHFLQYADARTGAEWIGALRGLEDRGFIERMSPDSDFFKVTREGYRAADELQEFSRWDAKSVVLRARYMNAPSEEYALSCKGIVAIPPSYFEDQTGADGAVMRNLKERRSLLVEGVGTKPALDWKPTEIEFVDDTSGQVQKFEVEGMEFVRPASLKLGIVA
jgi:hypothetical protein